MTRSHVASSRVSIGPPPATPGVVEGHVQAAEARDDLRNYRRDASGLHEIGLDKNCISADSLDLCHDGLALRRPAPGQGDMGAFLGEQQSASPANAGRSACDQSNLTL